MTRARTWFYRALIASFVLRLVLAAVVPMTSDEAYFFFWGVYPGATDYYGFYDHPPMIGWVHALIAPLSWAPWAVRLPSVLLLIAVALLVVRLARPAGDERAYLAGLSVLLVPSELLNVVITTDTPLVFFSVCAVAAYARALDLEQGIDTAARSPARWYALTGACLGAALLSKYFAVLLALAFLVFVLTAPRGERGRYWRGLLIIYAVAAPFVLLNVVWNYQHCWGNLMFNLYNRHDGDNAGFRWDRPLGFIFTLVYTTSIVVLAQLGRSPKAFTRLMALPRTRLLVACTLVPVALFAMLSPVKTIGLHWVFSFVPLFFAAAAFVLSAEQLITGVKFLAAFAGLHLIVLGVVAALPLDTWARTKLYDGLVMTTKTDELLAKLAGEVPDSSDFVLAADSYSPAVTLGYNARRYVPVFGEGSSHARHDDLLTDFRALAGKNILIVRKRPALASDYDPFFDSVDYRELSLRGATFYLVLGHGFRYEPYRNRTLAAVRDKYYRIPAYLPQGHCSFCERYFEATCPVR